MNLRKILYKRLNLGNLDKYFSEKYKIQTPKNSRVLSSLYHCLSIKKEKGGEIFKNPIDDLGIDYREGINNNELDKYKDNMFWFEDDDKFFEKGIDYKDYDFDPFTMEFPKIKDVPKMKKFLRTAIKNCDSVNSERFVFPSLIKYIDNNVNINFRDYLRNTLSTYDHDIIMKEKRRVIQYQ